MKMRKWCHESEKSPRVKIENSDAKLPLQDVISNYEK